MENQTDILKSLIEEGNTFSFANFAYPNKSYPGQFGGADKPTWAAWKTRCKNIIASTMAPSSACCALVEEALNIGTDGWEPSHFERVQATLIKALELTVEAIETDAYGERINAKSPNVPSTFSNKVFIVHGHDDTLKTDLERFLRELGLEPIVLHRQPDKGQTLIEKFETHSDVGYAFVLLTPDEVAYTIDQEKKSDANRVKERRSRPNVIFEFGFFVGKLGRSRVCCIYRGNVVLPSDLNGLIYKKVDGSVDDSGFAIIKELKAAGYKVSL